MVPKTVRIVLRAGHAGERELPFNLNARPIIAFQRSPLFPLDFTLHVVCQARTEARKGFKGQGVMEQSGHG